MIDETTKKDIQKLMKERELALEEVYNFELWWDSGNSSTKFWQWLAQRLPKRLVYSASIRLISHATTGKYGNTVVPQLTAVEALERWGKV